MSPARILLIDDADETRNFLANSILAPEGYDVITANSAHEALPIIRQQPPALIISDYLMPGMTGLDLLRTLKREGRRVPFILITAEGSEALAVQAMRLGVRDYLIKPFSIDDFLDAIERVLKEVAASRTAIGSGIIQNFLKHASSPIILLDQHRRLLFASDAARRLFEIAPQVQIGIPVQEAVINRDLINLIEEADSTPARQEIRLPDDQVLMAELTVIPQQGHLIIMQDMTQIKAIDRVKSDFISTLSQDLRSPLTAILGYLDLMDRGGTLNDQQQKYRDHIVFSVQSMNALLTDLLDLSKIEAGIETGFEPTRMDIVLRYALEAQRIDLERRGHQLQTQIDESAGLVMGNPNRLKQLVSNLLDNAIKYTPTRGKISVKLYQDNGFVVLQIADSGIGIPLDDQPHIWDKFYRTDEAMNGYSGTGLGLAIVKTIVDIHGGRIWVESTPGEGSCFTVMLAGVYE